ncbi:MAG TPA: hypothetical protein PK027_09560 [Aquimonas sp.]|nr:hypothetical protein [Aquimonas sp.]
MRPFRRVSLGFANRLVFGCSSLICSAATMAADGPDGVQCGPQLSTVAQLLDPQTSVADRALALRTVQDLARNTGGRAAQILGALYAVGVSHPSSAVNADAEMARLWFRRCLLASSATCPVTTLSDWAELELREGQGREAAVLAQLQAQITTLAQAQVGKPRFLSGYDRDLLLRTWAAAAPKDEAEMQSWVSERMRIWRHAVEGWVTQRVAWHRSTQPSRSTRKSPSVLSARLKHDAVHFSEYLVEMDPDGGRPLRSVLVTALPKIEFAELDGVALSNIRLAAYTTTACGHEWTFAPVSYAGESVVVDEALQ